VENDPVDEPAEPQPRARWRGSNRIEGAALREAQRRPFVLSEGPTDRLRIIGDVPARAIIVALGAALLLAVMGCGASDRAPDAAAVAELFHGALQRGDGEAACAELSEDTARKLEQQEEMPCGEAVLSLDLPRGGIAATADVYVTSASVTLAGGGTTFLDEGSQGWKVSAAGCTPTAPNLPYDCLLEG
jgi:hypothetical protein